MVKRIYVNLKRFDIPAVFGGVNHLCDPAVWGSEIVRQLLPSLSQYEDFAQFCIFFPEAHLLNALATRTNCKALQIGCQSVYREDVTPGGNFGAFTSNRPATAMKSLGCQTTIIGHCEERKDKADILLQGGVIHTQAVDELLNQQIKAAVSSGLEVLFCVGEKQEELERSEAVLRNQLKVGLAGVDTSHVTIAYEPVWAIGPGKTPPNKEYIQTIAQLMKTETNGLPVVYGGGLKADNAAMLASIPEIDGGLIALTRFADEIGFYPLEFLEIVKLYLSSSS